MRTSSELVEILDNYLKEKNLSRRQFCALVDIPNTTISSWKTKNVLPSIEFVAKIAKFMNVSLDWLVNGDLVEEYEIFDLNYLVNIYEIMFKFNYDSKYYMLISMIIFFYQKTSGKFLITKEQLNEYFDKNLIPVAEEISFSVINVFDEQTVDNFYELLFVLQLIFLKTLVKKK